MDTNVAHLRTANDVRNFLAEQRKTYRNVTSRLPNGIVFATPEGIQEQVENAKSWPLDLCFYEIHNATEDPFTCNLTVRILSISKAQATTA